ncbi:MAG: UxaA family hydrolase [Armatimonadetes bacterium]|nr:UxaA family hydrolase [Armatimonadota bacterium]
MKRAVLIHPDDNVATVVQAVAAGETIRVSGAGDTRELAAAEAIPMGHKVALARLAAGDKITKYGETIGRATAAVASGACVHIHNMEGLRGRTGGVS